MGIKIADGHAGNFSLNVVGSETHILQDDKTKGNVSLLE